MYRGTHGTHQVVEVHHDVHPHVEEAAESRVPTSNEPGDCWIMLSLADADADADRAHLIPHQAVNGMMPW